MTTVENCIITFLGDVYLPKVFEVDIDIRNYIFNLEYPITAHDIGTPGKVNLRVKNNYIDKTFKKLPLAVCLSNNHINDYGDQGYLDTIAELNVCGIPYFGAGRKQDNCNNPRVVEIDGYKIGLLGYTCITTSPVSCDSEEYGVPLINLVRIQKDIMIAQDVGCIRIIVSLHWGAEQITKPRPEDVVIARSIIDQGADLIIGHHSHCIQDYDVYKGKYIFYGLGNCIFPNLISNAMYDPDTNQPQRRYKVRHKYWNKTSLAISYDIINESAVFKVLYFDGERLINKPFWIPGNATKLKYGVSYDTRFRINFLLGKLKNAFFSWLQSPKLPRLRHIKSIISLLNSKIYK